MQPLKIIIFKRGTEVSKGPECFNIHYVFSTMPRSPKSRKWSFTLHSFFPNNVIALRKHERYGCTFVIFGREICPTTGRRHLQGFLYFKHAVTRSGVKKRLGEGFGAVHLEASKGTVRENVVYCSKEGDFECYGEQPSQGQRADLIEIRDKIQAGVDERSIAEDHWNQWVVYRRSFAAYRKLLLQPGMRLQCKVYLIVGASGTGKTRYVYERFHGTEGGLWMSHDPTLKWFDGYNGEKAVLIDDFRGGADFEFMLRLLDSYPCKVPVKGDFVQWQPDYIFITSNTEPGAWYPDVDLAPLTRRIHRTARISAASNPSWDSVKEFLSGQFE